MFGALCGYGFARYQAFGESRARRKILAEQLRRELAAIDPVVAPYNPAAVIYRDPIHLTTLPHLLDGRTLDFKKHGGLIHALLALRIGIARYNDLVRVTNLAQATTPLPDNTHRQIYDRMAERHRWLVDARTSVEQNLASDLPQT